MFTTIKKIVIAVVCLVMILGGIIVPQKTYATVPVIDGAVSAILTSNTVTNAANWVTEVAQWAKTELFKTLRDKLIKYIFDEITKQTVEWIQGDGDPKFVTDWQDFLKTAATEAAEQTLSASNIADLCTPFKAQLRVALIPETKSVSERATCTLSKIVSNVQGFYDNFTNGGWLAYGEAIKPENNIYMQLVMWGDETKLKTNLSQEAKKQEAGAGSGFLSVSTCEQDNTDELFSECSANFVAEGNMTNEEILESCGSYADSSKTCTKKKVQTPGAAVGETVKNMIGSDNMFAAGAQGLLTAVIDAALNRMMTEGLALMSSTGSATSTTSIDAGSAYESDLTEYYGNSNSTMKSTITPTLDEWKVLKSYKNDSQTALGKIFTVLDSIKLIQDEGTQCPPLIAASDHNGVSWITNEGSDAQLTHRTTKIGLADDIAKLQVKITAGDDLIKKIDATGSSVSASTATSNAISTFTSKYIANNPSYATEKTNATNEKIAMNDKLGEVNTQLTTCKDAKQARSDAEAAVTTAESTPTHDNVATAQQLAGALPDGTPNKDDLVTRANALPL